MPQRVCPSRRFPGNRGTTMDLPIRKPVRLKEYDYSSPGAYFITVCTHEKRCILSSVRRGDPCGRPELILNEFGLIVRQSLLETEKLYHVRLSPYVIMPNHIHFICVIDQERATARVAPTVGRVVGAVKSLSSNRCRAAGLNGGLWQRSYYDHIVRNEEDYRQIADYIKTNPARWSEDRFHP